MQFNAVLSNREHPEYGVFTESFPVSRASYDDNIEMIRQLEIGVAVAQDCHVDEITGDWPVLRLMEHTQVNFDELDYLAQRLDSFDQYEKAQFQGMAAKLELHDVRELINLTFCCQDATVITDFSELDIAGRRHYMTLNGGGASPDELKKLDARAFAEELIDYNIGYVTHFGVVYPNGMEMPELYDGRHFPKYRYEDCVMEVEMSSRHTPADSPATYIYLPMTQVQIERAMLRAGVDSYADMRLRFLESELPDANTSAWTQIAEDSPAQKPPMIESVSADVKNYSSGTTYSQGDYCVVNGVLYQRTGSDSSKTGIDYSSVNNGTWTQVSSEFVYQNASYKTGDKVWYKGQYYTATKDFTTYSGFGVPSNKSDYWKPAE